MEPISRSRLRFMLNAENCDRFAELRGLAGRSFEDLSNDLKEMGIEITARALREFENGVYKTFADNRAWSGIAAALGESPFWIPAGVKTWFEAIGLYTVGGRIQLLQWTKKASHGSSGRSRRRQ